MREAGRPFVPQEVTEDGEEEGARRRQAPDPCRAGDAGPPRGERARPARREHHGVRAPNQSATPPAGRPGILTILEDRSFTFIAKQPPAAELFKQAVGVEKGSGEPNREKVGRVTQDQLRRIAEQKMVDLNANDVDAAMKILAGTARSMGVEVVGA